MQIKLHEWAKKVVQTYKPIGKSTNVSYYTQSDLTIIKESPDILVLGINPGSAGEYKELSAEEFLTGNPDFSERETEWHLWKRLRKILSIGGIDNLINDESRFVFSNVFHFGTLKDKDLTPDLKDEKLVGLTIEFIKTLKPTRVLCLGKSNCFKQLKIESIDLIQGELSYGKLDDIPIYGIPHTSSYYTNEECVMIGKVLAALFRDEIEPNAEIISIQFKDEIKAFEDRRDQLKPNNIRNYMVESAFDKYSHLQRWEIDNRWYYVTDDIVARVASNGYVNIRHSDFNPNDNYSKHVDDNKYPYREELIECLKKYGYELTKNDLGTSLGHKPFNKYLDADKGPQYIVLSILQEFEKLKMEFESVFAK